MLTEDYVSFEIAKLLKEKGFMKDAIVKFFASGYDSKGRVLNIRDTEMEDYPRPTLQMAMKWLREKEIFVEVTHILFSSPHKYKYSIFCTEPEFYTTGDEYKTYEEACEAAIKYCLEKLI